MESEIEVIQHAGVTCRRRSSTRKGHTDEVIRKNDRDNGQAIQASTNVSMRQRRASKRLVNYARRTAQSQTSTCSGRTGCTIGQMVKSSGKQSRQYQKDKLKAAVFKLILRMQDVVFLFIPTCIWSMMQLFDCEVPGKFQLLQIPETCDKASVLEY